MIDVERIRSFFFASAGLRRLLTLLTDASHPLTPLPFKYLSLYKVLELELRTKAKWVGLKELLQPYEDEFGLLGISNRRLINFLHHFRDRCAHIKTGHMDEIGLTGLDSDDAALVRSFLPLFRKIVIGLLNDRYKDRFQLSAA